ncbi:MAG TPA: hybrid sensor histidine kinase/response regulator [Abditibacteriaceae bacterium]|jgi:two-component system chemotaxis sensor kinase CheA
MIEDKELLSLFREECEEYLQNLDDGLMRLETEPHDAAVLQHVFRDAHSLKGAARMLGLSDIEIVAHQFEDALGGAARGGKTLASGQIETLLQALDALRSLVREAVTGQASGVNVAAVLTKLQSAPAQSTVEIDRTSEASQTQIAAEVEVEPEEKSIAPLPTQEIQVDLTPEHASEWSDETRLETVSTEAVTSEAVAGEALSAEAVPVARWNIETIRVEPSRLDSLLAMAGELVVATTRARRGRIEFEALRTWREDAAKAVSLQNHALRELERTVDRTGRAAPREEKNAVDASALRELRRLAERETERLEALDSLLVRLGATYEDVNRLDAVVAELESSIRGIRLLPLSTLFQLFPRPVRDLAKAQDKEIRFIVEGGETTADKRILEDIKDPLMHMIRNAIDHGIEPAQLRAQTGKPREATLRLRGYQTATQVVIELSDDGRGLDLEAIRRSALQKGLASEDELRALQPRQVQNLIFAPGFSTSAMITDVSGRGVGLDVVRANVERLRGTIYVESAVGKGCTFRLTLPVTLATMRVLLVQLGERSYAIPVENIERIQRVLPEEIFALQGRASINLGGAPVPIVSLAALLGLPRTGNDETTCVILADGSNRLAVTIDTLIDEQEIMLKPLGVLLGTIPAVMGATILDTGDVCLVLQPQGLLARAGEGASLSDAVSPLNLPDKDTLAMRPKTILLVEDSITTRTQEKRILEGAGYSVVTAVDGLDGWQKLQTGTFDAVVSDVEMPNLDGLSLAARIRADAKHSELPIILVTSLASEEDRRRGVEVGASAYITKGTFDQKALLDALKALV